MTAIFRMSIMTLALFFISVQHSTATSLHVTPVMIDLTAPAGAGVITLRNDGTAAATVQLRVFKWMQQNGEDTYLATKDVVVSPPMTKLAPGAQQTIRVVRTKKTLAGQESYRLFVDEVPQATQQKQTGIRFLIRQSIPVFFNAISVEKAKVSWSASSKGRNLTLTARNSGADRLKVSKLLLKDQSGKVLARVEGLTGYVLGGSTRQWNFTLPAGTTIKGRALTLTAEDDKGPIRASVTVVSGG